MKTRLCNNPELIENYELAKKDDFKGWVIHHRLETHTSDGILRDVFITPAELKALDMYFNRPADELIFMIDSNHKSLHHKCKDVSLETKMKLSESHKGQVAWNKGIKLGPHTDEWKAKVSEKLKGKKRSSMSEEQKQKISETKKAYYKNNLEAKEKTSNARLKAGFEKLTKCKEAYKESGRRDWNTFQKEFFSNLTTEI